MREASRRELIETAARKEVFMMVPVAVLVLPVTVLVAFWVGTPLSPSATRCRLSRVNTGYRVAETPRGSGGISYSFGTGSPTS